MKPIFSMREALTDERLLGSALPGDSFKLWRTILIAAMGEPLTADERDLFRQATGREQEPGEPVEELWCAIGRRGGKSRAVGTLAAYIGTCVDFADYLAPGQRGQLPVLATATNTAVEVFRYIRAAIEHSPDLSGLLLDEPTSDTIRLTAPVDIMIRTASWRTIRGITAVAAILDEIAFFRSDNTANPDTEILNALRPALATTGGPLVAISSPYARRGELWKTHRKHYGPQGDPRILVAGGPSRMFNSTLPQSVIDRAYEADAAAAAAEYGGEFRSDIEAFITLEVVEACIEPGVRERPPIAGVSYQAFVDPSGGSSDAMTLAISHREGDVAVLDAIRERKPPFSPEGVVGEFCDLLRAYRVTEVTGDRYGVEWVREPFRKLGVEYRTAEHVRSDLYRSFLPILNSRKAELLDNRTLVSQLTALERRVSRGGREAIDHAPGAHDDVANAVAGAVSLVSEDDEKECGILLTSRHRLGLSRIY